MIKKQANIPPWSYHGRVMLLSGSCMALVDTTKVGGW
jgi:hypothetical protein